MTSPIATAPASVAGVATAVNHRIAQALDADAARWTTLDTDLGVPLGALRTLVLAGGKRLRPAFCYWAFVGAGGDPSSSMVIDAGAALELLHVFALIHDDVMDGSCRRHGQETLHRRFARLHSVAGWQGTSEAFGQGVAVLMGDLAHVYADLLMAGAPAPAFGVFNELRLEVIVGQYLDLLGGATRSADPGLARRICQYKTGKYTVERPLHLGAALASPWQLAELAEPLSAYGLPLGEAFQLKDDLLGCFGDPLVTGKPVGDDLRDGKPTMLMALARGAASGAGLEMLEARHGAPDLSAAEVADMLAVIEASGARRRLEAVVEGLVADAVEAAAALPLDEPARAALTDMAHYVAGRDH
ncbi:MAG: polyprenyl synthetase family protein [Acidimicrobiales bacterium]